MQTDRNKKNDFTINPFSGEFIITMSHLPGRVLNIKIPRARPFY